MWGVSAEYEPSLFHTSPLQKLKLLCLITLFTMFLLILWLHGKKWETQVRLVIIEGKKSVKVSDLLLPCKGSGTLIFGPVRFARIFLVYNELKMVGGLFWSHVCVNQENFEVCLRLKPVWLWWDPNSWCFCKRCVRSICLCCGTCDLSGHGWCQNHLLQITASPFPFQHMIMYTSTYQMSKRSWSSCWSTADILSPF